MFAGHAERHPRLTQFGFFFCGAATMLSFAPFGLFPVAAILLLPFLYASFFFSPRIAAWNGFWFGAGLFFAGTYWFYTSIHVFGQAPLWVAIFIMVGLVMIMGIYYAATAWLINRLAAGNLLKFSLAAPATWIFMEWLRGWFLSGFPWMSLGYSQIDSPMAGFAPLVGVYGVGLVLLISSVALFVAIQQSGRQRLVAAVVFVLPWMLGVLLTSVSWTQPAGDDVRVTIVQGGVSQDRKWLPEQFS